MICGAAALAEDGFRTAKHCNMDEFVDCHYGMAHEATSDSRASPHTRAFRCINNRFLEMQLAILLDPDTFICAGS